MFLLWRTESQHSICGDKVQVREWAWGQRHSLSRTGWEKKRRLNHLTATLEQRPCPCSSFHLRLKNVSRAKCFMFPTHKAWEWRPSEFPLSIPVTWWLLKAPTKTPLLETLLSHLSYALQTGPHWLTWGAFSAIHLLIIWPSLTLGWWMASAGKAS